MKENRRRAEERERERGGVGLLVLVGGISGEEGRGGARRRILGKAVD